MKIIGISISIIFLLISSASAWPPPKTDEPKVTKAENQEARELALQFIIRLSETKALSGVVNDLYFTDFIERFRKSKANDIGAAAPVDLYFSPGLDYNSRLLTEGDSKDWARLYLAVNDFLFFGSVSFLKNSSDDTRDIKPTDIYPAAVMKLLSSNPILANMIVRKEGAKAIGTVEEMRGVTAMLEQAVTMMREQQKSDPPLIKHKDELIKTAKTDAFFKPRLEVTDKDFFGFPKGTRVLFVKTPLGFELMLAREQDRLRVFWTEIVHD